MDVTKKEMIDYLNSILKRYEYEENKDLQFENLIGRDKYIDLSNDKAWRAKQRKIEILKSIIEELEGNKNEKH